MKFDLFRHEEIDPFLAMAGSEGWLSDRWEFEFLLQRFPHGCFVIRQSGGAPLAFVTAITHSSSGWIGNLIVREEARRKGLGSFLMGKAMDALFIAGARTIWLTASSEGAPLYARMGFRDVDRIGRWMIERTVNLDSPALASLSEIHELIRLDKAGWGDDRTDLCQEKSRLGTLKCDNGSCLVVHQNASVTQIGPWASDSIVAAERSLDCLFSGVAQPGKTMLDVPSGNAGAVAMLVKKGFIHCSEAVLMYHGHSPPNYSPEMVFALATFGSLG